MFCKDAFVVAQVTWRDVKPLQRIGKAIYGQVAEKRVEQAKRTANLSCVVAVLNSDIGLRVFNKTHRTPERPVGVCPVVLPVL